MTDSYKRIVNLTSVDYAYKGMTTVKSWSVVHGYLLLKEY